MKKTRLFIFITAFLLTLLMVVGCDVYPVAKNADSDVVLASISIASSRSLTNGQEDSLSRVSHFDYMMEPMWKIDEDSVSEKVYGIANDWYYALPDDGVIGWVTPGLWKVSIYGFNEDGLIIYYGETEVYFSSINSNATVVMSPYEKEKKEAIEIDILQPMLSSNKYEYNYIYRLYDSTGNVAVSDGNRIEGIIAIDVDNSDDINGNYKALLSNIDRGMYSLGVYCYRNDSKASSQLTSVSEIMKGELIGGEVKKVFLCYNYNQPFLISGTLDFSDFVKADINFSSLNVSGTLTAAINGKITSFTLQDDTSAVNGSLDGYSVDYQWYVNGVRQSETGKNFTFDFKTYGPKEVSCVIVYTSGKEIYTATVKDTFTLTPSSV